MTSQKQHIIKASILLSGLLVGIILVQNPQILENKAQAPQCSVTTAYCRWDKVSTATLYGYIISDLSGGKDVSRGTVNQNQVSFTIITGHTYRCSVYPINNCGVGQSRKAEQTCSIIGQRIGGVSLISPTLTPALTTIPTLTLTPTLNPLLSPHPTISSISSSLTGVPTGSSQRGPTLKAPTPSVKPLIPVKTLNQATKLLSYAMAFVLAVCAVLIIFRLKGRKKTAKPSTAPITGEKDTKSHYVKIAPSAPEDVYYVKPYTINSEDKSIWVTLTKKNTETLGLCHDTEIKEGYYKVTGKLEKADDIPFIDIAKMEKTDKPS